jgi:hypothetical protein
MISIFANQWKYTIDTDTIDNEEIICFIEWMNINSKGIIMRKLNKGCNE